MPRSDPARARPGTGRQVDSPPPPPWPGWPRSRAPFLIVTCACSPPGTATPAGTPTLPALGRRRRDSRVLVLLADRRAGRKSGWPPWAALTIGTAASLAANIVTAQAGAVSRVIAGWPAVALLIAVKLLSGILEHRAAAGDPAAVTAQDSARPGDPVMPQAGRRRAAAGRARGGLVPGNVTGWEQAAKAVRDELRRDGRPPTRDALAGGLRAAGYPVRNSRLTPLLAALRAEPAPPR